MAKFLCWTVNSLLVLVGILLAMFSSWATIGSPEDLKQAAETAPYKVFFTHLAFSSLLLSLYAMLAWGINRYMFTKASNPAKVFWFSLLFYLLINSFFAYTFVRDSLSFPQHL